MKTLEVCVKAASAAGESEGRPKPRSPASVTVHLEKLSRLYRPGYPRHGARSSFSESAQQNCLVTGNPCVFAEATEVVSRREGSLPECTLHLKPCALVGNCQCSWQSACTSPGRLATASRRSPWYSNGRRGRRKYGTRCSLSRRLRSRRPRPEPPAFRRPAGRQCADQPLARRHQDAPCRYLAVPGQR